MSTVGDRIKECSALRGMSRPQLAKAAGIPYPTLAGIENGDQKTSTELDAIARALRVRLEYLKTGKGDIDLPQQTDDEIFGDIPASLAGPSMGDGSEPDEYAETHKLKFRRDSLMRKHLSAESLKVYYGKGDSMEPTLHDSDAIMFDTSDRRPEDDSVFVIWHENRLYVKRLRVLDDGTILITSDNPIGKWRKQIQVKPGQNFEIEGKVKWIGRWLQC